MAKDDFTLNTPPDILQKIRRLAPGQGIGLDPCSNPTSLVRAKVEWTEKENGLSRSWRGYGLVFMNPPHNMSPHNIEPWIEKAWSEFAWSGNRFVKGYSGTQCRDQFVGLIPAKPDTAWFHQFVTKFPRRVFLRGRLVYWKDGKPTKGPGKFGSMLVYAGARVDLFDSIFGDMGWLV